MARCALEFLILNSEGDGDEDSHGVCSGGACRQGLGAGLCHLTWQCDCGEVTSPLCASDPSCISQG